MTHVFHSFKTDSFTFITHQICIVKRKFKSSYFDSVHCPEKTSPHISNLRFLFHFFTSVSLKTTPSKFLHHQKNQLSQSHLDLYQHLSKAWDVNRNAARGTAGLCGRVSMFFFSLQGGWDYKIDMHLRDVLSLLIFPPQKEWRWMVKKKPSCDNIQGDNSSSFQVGLRQYDFIWRCPADFVHEFPTEQTKTPGAAGCTFLFTLVSGHGGLHLLFFHQKNAF